MGQAPITIRFYLKNGTECYGRRESHPGVTGRAPIAALTIDDEKPELPESGSQTGVWEPEENMCCNSKG